jgi:hypothetical protein
MKKGKIIGGVISLVAILLVGFYAIGRKKRTTSIDTESTLDGEQNAEIGMPTPNCLGNFLKLKNKRWVKIDDIQGFDWSAFATAIKVDIADSTSDDVDAYNEYVEEVRAFFYAYDILPSGAYVRLFKSEIKNFIDQNLGTVKDNWTRGQLRCSFVLS